MEEYIPSPELLKAKEVAEHLNRPLLLSGEPGTGKTSFAKYVANTENKVLFVFDTKSVSIAQNLFYEYDAVAHFANKEKSAIEFITLNALGKAIVNAMGLQVIAQKLLEEPNPNFQLQLFRNSSTRNRSMEDFLDGCDGKQSVVLIDEIDKAPRDFPNDILNEIEGLRFNIRELGLKFELKHKRDRENIFLLLTSNFEKSLPDAFLRRCLFFNIEFPGREYLAKIIKAHLRKIDPGIADNVDVTDLLNRIDDFFEIRNNEKISKKPATSEFIDCVKWLVNTGDLNKNLKTNKEALLTIIKKNDDLSIISGKSN